MLCASVASAIDRFAAKHVLSSVRRIKNKTFAKWRLGIYYSRKSVSLDFLV